MASIFEKLMEDISLRVEKYNEDYQFETDKMIRDSDFELSHTLRMIERAVDQRELSYQEYILQDAKEHNLDIEREVSIHLNEEAVSGRRERDLKDICRGINFETLIMNLMNALLRNDKLFFDFGKYKGRIVQDIYEKDRNYCKWFLDNVQGRTPRTLQVIDFISKKERGKAYTLTNPVSLYNRIIKEYSLEKYDEWIDKDFILSEYINNYRKEENKESFSVVDEWDSSSSCTRGDFYEGENSAFWNSMIDVEDIVDYEDLC